MTTPATAPIPAPGRRSLKYIRLAAFLAAQPPEVTTIEMTTEEIQDLVGADLPAAARFPSWWRNDEHRTHSRAWMSAGWEVARVVGPGKVEFVRSN